MALVSLILGQVQKGTRIARDFTGAGITSSLFLDATVAEKFSAPSEVTEHPIEEGGEISDHIIIKSQKLNIQGIITETPYTVGAQVAGVISTAAARIGQSIGGSVGAVLGAVGVSKAVTMAGIITPKSVTGQAIIDEERDDREQNNLPGDNIRLRDAVAEFLNIRASRQTINIITGLKLYKNFVMTGCEISRDKTSGQSISVSLEFMEVRVAESDQVKVAIPSTKNGLKKQEIGRLSPLPTKNNGSAARSFAATIGSLPPVPTSP
jgi:hypothetical protein